MVVARGRATFNGGYQTNLDFTRPYFAGPSFQIAVPMAARRAAAWATIERAPALVALAWCQVTITRATATTE